MRHASSPGNIEACDEAGRANDEGDAAVQEGYETSKHRVLQVGFCDLRTGACAAAPGFSDVGSVQRFVAVSRSFARKFQGRIYASGTRVNRQLRPRPDFLTLMASSFQK